MAEDLPYVCLRRDGSKADVLVSARIDLSADGELAHVMASVVDVTDQLKAEADRDKAEAALRQSQKLETIGQLTGGVAHDFNNLLMAIRSSLSLIERRLAGSQDEKTGLFIANAIKATERGASLTQRMLAFARKQDLNPTAVDIPGLLRNMVDLLERSIGPQIELDFDLAPEVPAARVDANQLEMALLNLALNARDAMNGVGRIQFKVEMRSHPGDAALAAGDYIVISLVDAGEGMDEATLAQAMEPFFTTKGTGKGTGLGLPMVYGLATQSGGTFTMHSKPGEGTRAEIWLPRAGAQQDALQETTPRQDAPQAGRTRRTILAVDDDVLVLMGTVGLMEDLGHVVLEATSGSKALQLVEAHPEIDLVITDHAMPKMTGVQLAQAISALRPDLPVVLASGYAEMPEGGERYIAHRLEKPFSDAMLEKVLTQMLPAA
jgi:signal transduction histidine kinase